MHRVSHKQKAISLRKDGMSYSGIASAVGVSKSTSYLWTSSVELDETVRETLSTQRREHISKLAHINIERRKARDAIVQHDAEFTVRDALLDVSHKRLLCAVMFWCEGGKDTGSGMKFINSDPIMIKTFLRLLRESFGLDESKFRVLVHLHEYHNPDRQLEYWSDITRIPLSQFNKYYLKPHTGKNIRENYPGCISLRYLDASLGKSLKMIYSVFGRNIGE